ncbi:MAG TPA: endonuclease NucS domain-containing protein [Longimicrobium sp.]|jgi:hypothetical protein|uniref:endonuclease NucS domain-containing protein n=1 Tax=Longimicrobium sp. TaxID=2029185 RepID=UPI002ED918FE
MAEEQTQALSLRAAYAFGAANGLRREVEEIRQMAIEWDVSYTSSLRRGYVVALLEKHDLYERFKQEHWSFGNTPRGETRRRRYLRIKAQYEEFLAGGQPPGPGPEPDPEPDESLEFALEAHLRDFLARNLDRIEPGLRLYESGERRGIEFPVEGGRIDLLAIDQAGKYVVIELKLSRGRNKALGQLLYYMGWIDQHLGQGPCRGYIIASEITDELAIAVSRVPGVSLAKYRMSFAIEPVARA